MAESGNKIKRAMALRSGAVDKLTGAGELVDAGDRWRACPNEFDAATPRLARTSGC